MNSGSTPNPPTSEDHLGRAEDDFHAVFEATSVGMAQADPATRRLLRVNAAFCAITGYDPVELLAMTIDDITHPEDRTRDRDRFSRLVTGEIAEYRFEKRFLRKDESVAWVHVTGNLIRDRDGRPLHTVAMVHDVTAQNAALEASAASFRRLADAMPQFVWVTEPDGMLSYVNARWTEFSGLDLHQTNDPATVATVYHPDDRDRLGAAWAEAFASGTPLEIEARIRGRDGAYRWFLIRSIPTETGGNGTRWFGTSTDVTANKESEARIAAANERFARAEEAAVAFSYEWDVATGRVERSAGLRGVLGYEPEDLEPTWEAWIALIHPADVRTTTTGAVVLLESLQDDSLANEYRVRHKDGRYRWLSERATLIRDAAGRLQRVIGHAVDITERKEAEADRIAFLDALAHDVKNPLGVAKGHAQIARRRLRRGVDDPVKLDANLDGIEAATAGATALIDELLDVARLRAGHLLDLRQEEIDLVALAEAAAEEARSGSPDRVVRVEADVATLVGVWDEPRLRRVLGNLLGNALKFSPNGGEVVVRVGRETDDAGTWAILAVRDRGVGIPAKDLPRIFERFQRGGNVGSIVGTGIGLAGARQIVEQHGGTIAATSAEGEGTTFTVRLPVAVPLSSQG